MSGWKDFSITAASNTNALTGVNWDEGMAPSAVNDSGRQLIAYLKEGLGHKGADIATGSTSDVATTAGLMHDLTGTTAVTTLGTANAGLWKILKFEGACTLTHNATSLIIPGAANIVTADGDIGIFISEGSGNWRCVSFFGKTAELISSTVLVGSAVGLSNSVSADITSISLTAGDWDVWGNVVFAAAGGTTPTLLQAWISVTSATAPTAPNEGAQTTWQLAFTAGGTNAIPAGMKRINLTSTTTVYLSAYAEFGVSTMNGYGYIGARRRRP